LEHSFLPGKGLWTQTKPEFRAVQLCATDSAGNISHACGEFLAANEKAREQWKLEEAFFKFEKKF
jgi:hypothetical protein